MVTKCTHIAADKKITWKEVELLLKSQYTYIAIKKSHKVFLLFMYDRFVSNCMGTHAQL